MLIRLWMWWYTFKAACRDLGERELPALAQAQKPKDWIQTYSRRKFFPLRPDPNQTDARDIAHALGMICRFTGHVRRFYSVAEHSVLVSRLAQQYAAERGAEPAEQLMIARWGLLHDASEAYLMDIAAPVKRSPEFELYLKAEKRLTRVILARFGLLNEEPAEVKRADLDLCATEAVVLMNPREDWKLPGTPQPGIRICGWMPNAAEAAFMSRFLALGLEE